MLEFGSPSVWKIFYGSILELCQGHKCLMERSQTSYLLLLLVGHRNYSFLCFLVDQKLGFWLFLTENTVLDLLFTDSEIRGFWNILIVSMILKLEFSAARNRPGHFWLFPWTCVLLVLTPFCGDLSLYLEE